MRALTGKEKLIGTEKREVRGLFERTLIEEKEGVLGDEWVPCGLPSFLECCIVEVLDSADLHHSEETMKVALLVEES